MSGPRIEQIVRNFQENGMKLLLEDPRNVRDLLGTARADVLDFIDFDNLELVKTTFVQRDYRHVETDVVLIAPLLDKRGRRSRRNVLIYILVEHQSEPDPLMPLRMLDYVSSTSSGSGSRRMHRWTGFGSPRCCRSCSTRALGGGRLWATFWIYSNGASWSSGSRRPWNRCI